MKHTLRRRAFLLVIIAMSAFQLAALSQVQTARYISTSANSNGFYEYLPQGYSTGSQQYPLLVFLHGIGEIGNGVSDLPTVLRNGPPKLIANGTFPVSFTSGGSTYSFIVISPQFVDWPTPNDVDAVIEYAKSHYRVNVNRIYLTGLSMGGGTVWDYGGNNVNFAKKLAGIVPVCGASYPDLTKAHIIASANLPVWATHNQGDPTAPVFYTNDYITYINSSSPPPSPLAKKTIFPVSGHDAWTTTYDPAFTDNGLNVYQWMLQYQLSAALPVVLGEYTASMNNTSGVTIKWNTLSESKNKNFIVERSLDGSVFSLLENVVAANGPSGHEYSVVDNKPTPGNNFYRLAQVDMDGKTTYFSVLKVIVPVSDNQRFFHLSPNPAINYTDA